MPGGMFMRKNQVTVTLFTPWVTALSRPEYDRLYRRISALSRDEDALFHPEANRMVSALTAGREAYSYETDASGVRFQPYAFLSEHLPDRKLAVRVTKAGSHILSGKKSDVTYYNAVQADYADGRMVSQMIGHVDRTGDVAMTDTVTLSGASMCPTLTALKGTAVMEAAKHEKSKTAASVPAAKQAETGMSL